MAYIFLLENDNEIIASHREVLMQRSKLVDEVWFLVNPKYKTCENDMSLYNVSLEYILPVSKSYHSLELTKDKEGYKEYLKYVVPLDTNLSSESGDIQLQLSFIYVGLDANGNGIQRVRKTKPAKLHITPIAAWGDIIPDSALSAIDQRIIATQAQINELGYYAEIISENQVDNLVYDDNAETLQLMAGKRKIGNKVSVRDMLDDGIPVVDLDDAPDHNDGCNCGCEDNVVEFGYGSGEIELPKEPDYEDNVVEF